MAKIKAALPCPNGVGEGGETAVPLHIILWPVNAGVRSRILLAFARFPRRAAGGTFTAALQGRFQRRHALSLCKAPSVTFSR